MQIYKDPHTGKEVIKPWPNDPRLNDPRLNSQKFDYTPLIIFGTATLVVAGVVLVPQITIPVLVLGGLVGAQ
jgi:hypothetical protein